MINNSVNAQVTKKSIKPYNVQITL